MSDHGFAKDQPVHVCVSTGMATVWKFGVVARATRHTIHVQYVKEGTDGRPDFSKMTDRKTEKFSWLRARNYMGVIKEGAYASCIVEQYDPSRNYESTMCEW
jgi:hypothetical protein